MQFHRRRSNLAADLELLVERLDSNRLIDISLFQAVQFVFWSVALLLVTAATVLVVMLRKFFRWILGIFGAKG